MDYTLDDDVRGVLSGATCNGSRLRLNAPQLPRLLYKRVAKALNNAGAKWKGGVTMAFVFADHTHASAKLAAMLNTGVSVDEKKRDQAFFTPPWLAKDVVHLADVRGCDVLEPEAGRGALVTACLKAGAARVFAIEKNKEYAHDIVGAAAMYAGYDFLALSELWGGRLFHRIVMNPPFTRNQDIKHVNHALQFLAPSGILTAIMFANKDRKGFVNLIEKYQPQIIDVERGAFKESGTDIPTLIVKITDTRRASK